MRKVEEIMQAYLTTKPEDTTQLVEYNRQKLLLEATLNIRELLSDLLNLAKAASED